MRKHNAYLKDENLLTLLSLNNFIVPEIQREYVWGNNPDVLEKFLKQIRDNAETCAECHHIHSSKHLNIGFLYSYKPSYIEYEHERIMDEFLIDGQQRITTLFLLLLYRATIEGRIDDFIAICRADENDSNMGFNYKVRNLTQEFIVQLINHVKPEKDKDEKANVEKIDKAFDFTTDLDNTPHWFLDDYKSDPTIMSMVAAIESIKKIFSSTENHYFDYLLTHIHFWHFKTEATSQGEELYITMNSRGEQLSDNEMQKARTLPAEDQVKHGKEWEEWQTFFWRNKDKNRNADKGFNYYLACIENLVRFNNGSVDFASIKIYMNALIYISNELKAKIESIYDGLYTGWFDKFIAELWREINSADDNWDLNDPRGGDGALRQDYNNKSGLRNKSMLFWPWMTYYKKCDGNVDDELLIRIIHFYYIRFHCYKRSATSIEKIIDEFIESNGRIDHAGQSEDSEEDDNMNRNILSEEEKLLSTLCFNSVDKIRETESAIWELQDLPYFLDGRDVGGDTVIDILNDEAIINKENLIESVNAFREKITGILVDGVKPGGNTIVKQILLFYKDGAVPFWVQQSPWYYNNYETSSWKRIVRTPHFRSFYKEFSVMNQSLDKFLDYKRTEFFENEENKILNISGEPWSHRRLCILYDMLSEYGIWDTYHINVAFRSEDPLYNNIFSKQYSIFKAIRYITQARVDLLSNWKDLLRNKYCVNIIESTEPSPDK